MKETDKNDPKKGMSRLLASLPDKPGIYVFRDAAGKPLYVGKAVSLKKRVRSYFGPAGAADERISRMLRRMRDFDFVVAASETEALLLESNFIKHHHPPFNIMLRDDKSYPYVAITWREEFPRVFLTRRPHRRGIDYFGPFTSAGRVRQTLELLGKIFPYRKCHGHRPGRRTGSPCLNYHIGLCLAPCAGRIGAAEYGQLIKRVERLLSGHADSLEADIAGSMGKAASAQRYEEAAFLRNRLLALRHLLEDQQASAAGLDSVDVIGLHCEDDSANIQVLLIRDGLLSDRRSFFLGNVSGEHRDEILEQFIMQYYSQPIGLPAEVVLPSGFRETEALADYLTRAKGSRVDVKRATTRGRRRELGMMAAENAELALKQDILREEEKRARPARALADLKSSLGLKRRPLRIECYDISNTAGGHPAGSMVVFEAGLPRRSHYRKFAVKTAGPDDYAMMAEVISRRFSRSGIGPGEERKTDESFAALPDLILVDGGAGQVSAAAAALETLYLGDVDVAGLAKKREEVYLRGRRGPLILAAGSPGLSLLIAIRNEAHRFAIEFHRQRRDRELSSSILDEIPGIGPSRKRAILVHFGSPERFLAAGRDELEAVPGLPAKVAREAYAIVHKLG